MIKKASNILSLFFTVFAIFAITENTTAQNCGQEFYELYQNKKYESRKELRELQSRRYIASANRNLSELLYIPIHAYITKLQNGAVAISECELKAAINDANTLYEQSLFRFYISGISYVNNENYYSIEDHAESDLLYSNMIKLTP